jgi:hypothetical protein
MIPDGQDCLGEERIGVEAVHAGEQVAELCAPVPQVVEPGHLSTNRFVDVRHIVTDYRRPENSRFLVRFLVSRTATLRSKSSFIYLRSGSMSFSYQKL